MFWVCRTSARDGQGKPVRVYWGGHSKQWEIRPDKAHIYPTRSAAINSASRRRRYYQNVYVITAKEVTA